MPNISVSVLRSKLKKKLAEEIEYTQCNCTGTLVDFLDIIGIRYQIDNVVNIIEGLKNKVDIQIAVSESMDHAHTANMATKYQIHADAGAHGVWDYQNGATSIDSSRSGASQSTLIYYYDIDL